MKLRKKVLAVFLCALLAVTPCSVAAAAIDDTGYRITNPYADVDWQNWEQYKANLHTHTDVSDGDDTLRKMDRCAVCPRCSFSNEPSHRRESYL